MSDDEINIASPIHGGKIIAQWDGVIEDTRAKDLHIHWSNDIDMATARWIWIEFAKPAWILRSRFYKRNPEIYPTLFAAYYSIDAGHQMVSLFEERKIMLGSNDTFVERGIAPVYSENILLVFANFSDPEKPYLPKLEDIEVSGYFDE